MIAWKLEGNLHRLLLLHYSGSRVAKASTISTTRLTQDRTKLFEISAALVMLNAKVLHFKHIKIFLWTFSVLFDHHLVEGQEKSAFAKVLRFEHIKIFFMYIFWSGKCRQCNCLGFPASVLVPRPQVPGGLAGNTWAARESLSLLLITHTL